MDRGVTLSSSRIDRCQLRRDHIYTWRKSALNVYSHHGIYESDSKVIHFTMSCSPTQTCWDCAQANRKGGVIITCLDCFLGTGDICLFAYSVPLWFHAMANPGIQVTCSMEPQDPPETVLHRANKLLADGFGMHFALYCKTGHHTKQSVIKLHPAPAILGINYPSRPLGKAVATFALTASLIKSFGKHH
ncbi:hypothetical protein CFC21_094899 [Triticum aestivum]|uniref:LRAT domain-containing protein n=2 Tax=Triticum aestivum TaxID=4565 RepID=A0A9R1LP35_WHEAT|nr:protein LEAD-SENSITIVE 1-like [Triticum aestivum]KAF7092409.1 hypothetical protein CFC21_094899 [Triticum aestivum]